MSTRITSLDAAHRDARIRLGHGASAGELTAVRTAVTILFTDQGGYITAAQSSAIVYAASTAADAALLGDPS